MEKNRRSVACQATGGPMERSAGRDPGGEVHQSGDCARTHLEGCSGRAFAPAEEGDARSVPGRIESSAGVRAPLPGRRSDHEANSGTDRVAAAQRARVSLSESAETRSQSAL